MRTSESKIQKFKVKFDGNWFLFMSVLGKKLDFYLSDFFGYGHDNSGIMNQSVLSIEDQALPPPKHTSNRVISNKF